MLGPMTGSKITADEIRSWKNRRRIAALTAYDFPMARLLDEAGIPVLLVGDSLGMVVLGYPDTTSVTMDEMEHHVRAVARAKPSGLVVADLPFGAYATPSLALENSRRLVRAGAEAVKAEGGGAILESVRAIVAAGIPFMGHLGMLPQHVREEGGYRVKGKSESEHRTLLEDAAALEQAGAFAMVLELVAPGVAAEITSKTVVPTIGIGSRSACDGQVLVTHDLVGMFPWFTPRFVTPKLATGAEMRRVFTEWRLGVEQEPRNIP